MEAARSSQRARAVIGREKSDSLSFLDLGILTVDLAGFDAGRKYCGLVRRLSAAISTDLEVSEGISMAVPNAVGESVLMGGGERKRKRGSEPSAPLSKWRTEGEQRIYSSRLIEALRRVCQSSASAPSASSSDHVRSCAVRKAADRVLAVSARGRTRWSRAILSGRTLKHRVRPKGSRPKPVISAIVARAAAQRRKTPALEKKTRVLGRLVPGCRKLPLPSLLEEASGYITALEMQVRAMSTIAEAFSAAGSASLPPIHANPM
ncbi:hypothetical protein ZIOFF_045297 [Zingiber officinale]|uniref:BHLH domain-containing protein n=2 Tax=Zingiber officinale TaxID=94328 RepID=A0A8J5G6N9_ZINOF|nr:hypothetical protein ZIOFF_045297 [Zingiber officinale]